MAAHWIWFDCEFTCEKKQREYEMKNTEPTPEMNVDHRGPIHFLFGSGTPLPWDLSRFNFFPLPTSVYLVPFLSLSPTFIYFIDLAILTIPTTSLL